MGWQICLGTAARRATPSLVEMTSADSQVCAVSSERQAFGFAGAGCSFVPLIAALTVRLRQDPPRPFASVWVAPMHALGIETGYVLSLVGVASVAAGRRITPYTKYSRSQHLYRLKRPWTVLASEHNGKTAESTYAGEGSTPSVLPEPA